MRLEITLDFGYCFTVICHNHIAKVYLPTLSLYPHCQLVFIKTLIVLMLCESTSSYLYNIPKPIEVLVKKYCNTGFCLFWPHYNWLFISVIFFKKNVNYWFQVIFKMGNFLAFLIVNESLLVWDFMLYKRCNVKTSSWAHGNYNDILHNFDIL